MPRREKIPPADNIPQTTPGSEKDARETLVLWATVLTGSVLWFAQQQLLFVLVPWACVHGGVVWLHFITAVCLLGTATAGGVAAARWRRGGEQAADWEKGSAAAATAELAQTPGARLTPGEQRALFMAKLGVFSSVFFALVIVAQGIPNFLLDPCQR